MKRNTSKIGPKRGFRPDLAGASIIVVTGPSGSGKSSLAAGLERKGWERVDGDALARSLYKPGSVLMKDLQRVFGKKILTAEGNLDSVRLGEIVFPSLAQRKRLNALVYPRFLRILKKTMLEARRLKRLLVADVAVYFDAKADLGVPVVLVDAPLRVRVQRILGRGMSAHRAQAQASALRFGSKERRRCALVLDGRLSKTQLQRQLFKQLSPAVS